MSIEAKKKIIVITLMVLCTFFLALANKSLLNNKLDSVKLSKEDKERFAIKIEDSNGDYIDYNEDTWPGIGYIFNEEESKCTTKNGEVIDNILEYTNGVVKVTTKKTVFCYLYFDIDNSALATTLLSGDYTLYDTEANFEAGTFYRYSGAYDGKRNVIYADHCWQIFRTTKNNSIKMIYNGEPAYNSTLDRYTCENDRTKTNHIGYHSEHYGTHINLGVSSGTSRDYYYGTGFYYDESSGAYKLSGEVGPYNWYYDHDSLIGMYTCKNTTANANCTMGSIYYIESYYSDEHAYIFYVNTGTVLYDRIGNVSYNYKFKSPADVGYMYNTRYVAKSSPSRISMLSSATLNTTYLTAWSGYYFGDREEGNNALLNPELGSSITGYPQSWVGKYTLRSSNQSYTNAISYYISGVNTSGTPVLYYADLQASSTKSSARNKYLLGTGFTSNNDGTVTMAGAKEVSIGDWYTAFNNGDASVGNYMCLPETYTYNSNNNTGICSNGINSILSGTSLTYLYYVPVNIKYGYSFEERTIVEQQDGKGRYKLVGDNNLTNSLHVVTDWITEYNTLTNSHYTCLNEEGICDTLYFITYTPTSISAYYYIEIPSNKTIDTVLNEMLNNNDINTNNSATKNLIDAWYKQFILNKEDIYHNLFSNYLDTDEIFCNNRAVYNYGGWNQAGNTIDSLQFVGNTDNTLYKVSCVDSNGIERPIDEFSVSSGNGSLIYPIGLPSHGELYIESMSTSASPVRKSPYGTGANYWLSSPYIFNIDNARERSVGTDGNMNYSSYVDGVYGVRPSLSLNHNVVFNEGDGTMTDPWIASLPN